MAEWSSVDNASEEVFEFICGPCSVDGEVFEAKGYCSDCQDYLCDLCFKSHLRLKPLRHHVLLDEKSMPKDKIATSTKATDICTERCEKHSENIIEYYCKSHDFLGCTKCFISDNHRKCDGVVCIKDKARDIFDNQEYKNFKGTVEQLAIVLSESSSIQLQIDEDIKLYSIRAKKDIKNFRANMNKYLDKLENEMDRQVFQMKDRQTSKLMSTSKQIDELENDIKTIKETNERMQNLEQKSNLYIYMKRNLDQLKRLEDRIETVKNDSGVSEYTFTPDAYLNKIKKMAKTFGMLAIKDDTVHSIPPPVQQMPPGHVPTSGAAGRLKSSTTMSSSSDPYVWPDHSYQQLAQFQLSVPSSTTVDSSPVPIQQIQQMPTGHTPTSGSAGRLKSTSPTMMSSCSDPYVWQEEYVSVYPYQSQEPRDLTFNQGEVILITKMDGDWWTGTIGDRTGIFPANYVKKQEVQLSEVPAISEPPPNNFADFSSPGLGGSPFPKDLFTEPSPTTTDTDTVNSPFSSDPLNNKNNSAKSDSDLGSDFMSDPFKNSESSFAENNKQNSTFNDPLHELSVDNIVNTTTTDVTSPFLTDPFNETKNTKPTDSPLIEDPFSSPSKVSFDLENASPFTEDPFSGSSDPFKDSGDSFQGFGDPFSSDSSLTASIPQSATDSDPFPDAPSDWLESVENDASTSLASSNSLKEKSKPQPACDSAIQTTESLTNLDNLQNASTNNLFSSNTPDFSALSSALTSLNTSDSVGTLDASPGSVDNFKGSLNTTVSSASPLDKLIGSQKSSASPLDNLMGSQNSSASPLDNLMGSQKSSASSLDNLMGSQKSSASPMDNLMGNQVSNTSPFDDLMANPEQNSTPFGVGDLMATPPAAPPVPDKVTRGGGSSLNKEGLDSILTPGPSGLVAPDLSDTTGDGTDMGTGSLEQTTTVQTSVIPVVNTPSINTEGTASPVAGSAGSTGTPKKPVYTDWPPRHYFSWAAMVNQNIPGSVPPATQVPVQPQQHMMEGPAPGSGPRSDVNQETSQKEQIARDNDEQGDMRRGARFPDSHQLFVGNLPHNVLEKDIRNFFEAFGHVVELRIDTKSASVLKINTKNASNFGFVVFDSPEPVQTVLNKNKIIFNGRQLHVEEKKPRGSDSHFSGAPPRSGFAAGGGYRGRGGGGGFGGRGGIFGGKGMGRRDGGRTTGMFKNMLGGRRDGS